MGKRTSFWMLLLLSGVGLLIALYLSHHHYALSFGKTLSFQLCQKGCDTVNTSGFSEFLGIPIASYGAVAYFGVFVLALLGLFLIETPPVFLLLSLILLIGLSCVATSFVLFGISIFKLSSFCSLCGLTYLINFLIAWVSGRELKRSSGFLFKTVGSSLTEVLKRQDPKQSSERYYQRLLMGGVWFIFFLSATSGVAVSYFHSAKYRIVNRDRLQQFMENYAQSPRSAIEIQGSPAKGSQNPKLTIAVFSDFTCGHCRNAAHVLDRLLPEYRKNLQIVYKHQVFDNACNPYEKHASPKKSCQLSKASVCAERYGKFWEYHDLLFEKEQPVPEKELALLAQKVGIDEERFSTCMQSPETEGKILKDIHEARRLGVGSTPTFFLNGRKIQGLPPTPLLHTLIRKEIREHSFR